MILQRVKALVRDQGEATLASLVTQLDAAPETVEALVEYWVRRGQIDRRKSPCAGKACACSCPSAEATVYVWTGGKRLP